MYVGSLSVGMPDLTKAIIDSALQIIGIYQDSQHKSTVPQLSSIPIMMYTSSRSHALPFPPVELHVPSNHRVPEAVLDQVVRWMR